MSNNITSNYNHVIKNLQDYMLYNSKMIDIKISLSEKNKNIIKNNLFVLNKKHTIKKEVKKSCFFTPYSEDEDKLFWCFYIIYNGQEEYENPFHRKSIWKRGVDFKIQSIEKIRKEKIIIKKNKLRIAEIEDELLNHATISLSALHALCIIYDINIIYVWKNRYYEILTKDTNKIWIIENIENIDRVITDLSEEKLTFYRKNFWQILNPAKPLKGFSAYSLSDLKHICNCLHITIKTESGKIKTRKDLYEEIIQRI